MGRSAGGVQPPVDAAGLCVALHAQHPAHRVGAPRVPAGAERRGARDGLGGLRRGRVRDARLDAGAVRMLARLIQRLGGVEHPRPGVDGHSSG